jgi:hypothetical protein
LVRLQRINGQVIKQGVGLDDGRGNFAADEAHVGATHDVEVSAVSPVGPPRVAHGPGGDARHGGPAGDLDAVVHAVAAVGGDHAAVVVLPVLRVDADRGRAVLVGPLAHVVLVVRRGDLIVGRRRSADDYRHRR